MHLAILGSPQELGPAWPALADSDRHDVRWSVGAASADRLPPGCRRLARWEDLLVAEELDAVLVVSTAESVLAAARQLAGNGIPLILWPAAALGSAFLYELGLTRDDRRVPLFPLFPLRRHPAVCAVHDALHSGQLGPVVQVQCARAEALPASTVRIPLGDCEGRLLWDVDLLRQLFGRYNQVTALRTGAEAGAVTSAHVTLAGPQLPEAIWSIAPGERSRWRLEIKGEQGAAVLVGAGFTEIDSLDIAGTARPVDDTDLGASLLDEFDQIEAAIRENRLDDGFTELVQEMEIVEATRQSVRRRRTIDLYFELNSERNQFKTQMTAIGCGVLFLTLLLMLLVLLIGQTFDLSPTAMQIARIVAFAPLFIFLGLQLLVFLARPAVEEDREPASDAATVEHKP